MNKEFIPYEQALELKKLGFCEQCIGYWKNGIGGFYIEFAEYFYTNDHWMFNAEDGKSRDIMCASPLYQQAFRFFREKHDLCSHIHTNINEYDWYIEHRIKDEEYEQFDHPTYEEAELACLKKLIEIIKNK